MKISFFLMKTRARCGRVVAALLATALSLSAQERFRMADPQVLPSSGLVVDPRSGGLGIGVPVGQVGGGIPIPLALRVNGQFKVQTANQYYLDTEGPKPQWRFTGSTDLIRPVHGLIHFGYIAPSVFMDGPPNSEFFVLENGAQLRTADFKAFTTWNATFTLAEDFGFSAKAPSAVQISTLAYLALYSATPSELGTWSTKITAPVGYGAVTNSYRVLMDQDLARVMIKLPATNVWVPVLWVDRFNHWVSFQWRRNTTNLPAGVTGIHSVEVKNHLGKGLLLQWADMTNKDSVQDLLRADFIGMDVPSLLVTGYPGVTAVRPDGMPVGNPDSDLSLDSLGGPVGRPKVVQIGRSQDLSQPSWAAYAKPTPAVEGGTIGSETQTWTFEYDANRAAIKSLKDPLGVVTSFSYENVQLATTQTYNYLDSGEKNKYTLGGLSIWGIAKILAADAVSGETLSRSWSRGVTSSGDPRVIQKETFGNLADCPRWTEQIYVPITGSYGRDWGNGAIKESRVWETGKTQPSSKTVYTLEGAGLDESYSACSGMVTTRDGEPVQTFAQELCYSKLRPTKETVFSGSPAIKLQETETTYEPLREKLVLARPIQKKVTRFAADGTALSPAVTTKTEYDPTKRLPSKSYREEATGQRGSLYFYDDDGRLNIQKPITGDAIPTITTYGYDPISGQPSGQGIIAPGIELSNSKSDFDSAGRARQSTDERGLITKRTFDTLGRVRSITPPAGLATTIDYPDVWTTTRTLGTTIQTEEKKDGFGRIMYQIHPDGSKEQFTYDSCGRLETRRRVSTLGKLQAQAITKYDALDRPTSITSPGGAKQTFSYTQGGTNNSWSVVAQTLNTPTPSSAKTFRNGLGQIVRQESPTGDVTESTFDRAGNLAQVVLTPSGNGAPQTRIFNYDEWGQLKERIEPETGTTKFQDYNWQGKPTRIEEAENRVRTMAYDGLGRLISMESGKEKLTYTFSGLDLMTMSSLADGIEVKQRFEYNGVGKQLSLEETTQPGLTTTIAYGYDPATALLSSLTYPSGRVIGYQRDGFNRISKITQNGSSEVVSEIKFDEWGNRQRLKFASGAYSDWTTKDNAGLQLGQWNIGYNNTLLDGTRFYNYDSAERLTMAGDWDTLNHDAQGRLTTANSASLGVNTTFGHDAYGNNIKHTATGNDQYLNEFEFSPMPTNRMPETALTGWKINSRGEATQIGVETSPMKFHGLGWDGLGRLKAVSYESGIQGFLYAPSGMRVSLVDSGNAANNRRYAYTSGGLLLGEYTEGTGSTGLRTLAATPTSTVDEPSKGKKSKTADGMVYQLAASGGGEVTGAWINSPSGPTTVARNQVIQFAGESDYGTSLSWTFGDGTTASGASAAHAFTTAGTYTVIFRASAVGYTSSTASVRITVTSGLMPTINTFSVSATTIKAGGFADLSWNVSSANSVSISGGIGAVALTGTKRVFPTGNTTYTLTATGSGGSVSSSVTVTVVQIPVIKSFMAAPASIQAGQSTKLTWSATNATSFSLNQGIGETFGTFAWVWPGVTKTFTLTAINKINGVTTTSTRTATVLVGAAAGVSWKRDVIYLGSEAVAEVDAGGVHELHNDHLGSPLIVTNGTTGQIEGLQTFGPYGERIKSQDYVPTTGYTGHAQQDATGLIYMRGRYYSPNWHRFVNSDQGVDSNSWNQMAYVGGSTFHVKDPSGMMMYMLDGTSISGSLFMAIAGMGGGYGGTGRGISSYKAPQSMQVVTSIDGTQTLQSNNKVIAWWAVIGNIAGADSYGWVYYPASSDSLTMSEAGYIGYPNQEATEEFARELTMLTNSFNQANQSNNSFSNSCNIFNNSVPGTVSTVIATTTGITGLFSTWIPNPVNFVIAMGQGAIVDYSLFATDINLWQINSDVERQFVRDLLTAQSAYIHSISSGRR